MDFLLAAEAVLNLSDNTLSVCNSTVPIMLNDNNSQSNIAFVSKTVYIPAGSVHNIVVDHTGENTEEILYNTQGTLSYCTVLQGVPPLLVGAAVCGAHRPS